MNCRDKQQLNITMGTDVVLHDVLIFDGDVFDPSLSTGIEANLVNSLGKRTSLDFDVVDDYLVIDVPWDDSRNAGCYGLEVRGTCNERKWATYADALIRYTRATREGQYEVEVQSDYYDITQVVSYRYNKTPIDKVTVGIDGGYGDPSADSTYDGKNLDLRFHNLRGNGIVSVVQTTESTEDEGVNVTTIAQDNGNTTDIRVRNGSKGSKGDKGDMGDSAVFDPSTGNIATIKQSTGDDTESPMSQKAVTDELAVRPYINDSSGTDLDIVDVSGNVLARFSEGHFRTRNFDSREKKAGIGTGDNDKDLDIVDGSGNVLATFSDGHIKTKNFDSRNLTKKPYQRVTRFSYAVDCNPTTNKDFDTPTVLSQYTQKSLYTDNAVLYLPTQYTVDGTPTKLILYCKHGASEINSGGDPIINSSDQNVFRYLLSLGYAILGADGVPDAFASEIGICERVVGNYIAVQSMREAYNYVMRNYNLDEEGAYIYGYSQGGHYAQNVIDLSGIPIVAAAEVSPVCSMRYHQWDLAATGTIGGVTWTKLARLNIARLFGFPDVSTNAQLLALDYDQENVQGYDPWTRNSVEPYAGFVQSGDLWGLPSGTQLSDIIMKKMLKCPLKVWCAENDNMVGVDVMKVFVKAAKNAGCVADMHLYSQGGHTIQSSQQSIGTFSEGGETCNLYPLAYEIALWFSQFGGYENIDIN